MYPDTIGARAGPAKGMREKIASASPRFSGPQMSEMVPPELERRRGKGQRQDSHSNQL